MKRFRIAVIGAGVRGDTPAAVGREHSSAKPAAVCGRNEQRARALAIRESAGTRMPVKTGHCAPA